MRNIVLKATVLTALFLGPGGTGVRAASVGVGGYTNSFASQPAAGDWATFSIAGASADIATPAVLDAAATNVAASSISLQTSLDSGDPPAAAGTATWSSSGFYLQTRPTGNGAVLLMCTLVNSLGGDASAVNISYDLARSVPVVEEVDGHRAYYSLTGAAGSWTVIPQLSSATPGPLTASLSIAWPSGGTLYILWADDNGSGTPDTVYQIDNFSVTATPATQTPVAITSQPQSQTVAELAPASFTVGVTGNPQPTFQWYKNNVPIGGATAATYAIASAPLSDNGAQFKVVAANTVSNVNYSVTSAPPAVLTVNADTVPPSLVSAFGAPPSTVSVDFSERLRADTANATGNYAITSAVGNLTILGAALSANGTNVILTTSTQTAGVLYTLIVSGVRDLSSASNQIAPNSLKTFTPAALTSTDVGSPAVAGSTIQVAGGYDVTGGGSDISGTSDQFQFNYQAYAGDFDVRVRLQSLSQADSWAKAGLMARETLTANSRYVASFATPSVSGCFFQFRTLTGGTTTNTGSFPVTYPNTWLRLRRVGGIFTGYASLTGESWVQLGSLTMSSPPGTMFVGMAVTSRATNQTVVGQFRSFENVSGNPPVAGLVLNREPLSASSRRTGLVISEIMYHPPDFTGLSNRLEFIEIFNSQAFEERIGGYRISGAVDYTFAPGTVIGSGRYLVVARDPATLQNYYSISGVLGPWIGADTNGLPGGSGNVRLRNRQGAVLLEVNYQGKSPWPIAADGAGHSLVLARPTYGEGNAPAWAASDTVGGSPGRAEPFSGDPLGSVVINEFLAHTDLPLVDYIELYNHSTVRVDLSGARLSDESSTIHNPAATNHFYVIPNGTFIEPTGYVSFAETNLGFALSSSGERLYLVNSNQTRVIDAIDFDSQANGVSMGRWPDGSPDWYPLAARTPGGPNGQRRMSPIVFNEIMYAPISGNNDDEYVELYNRSASPVNIGGWKLADGISFTFASNTVIYPGSYIVVGKSLTNLLAHYPNLNSTNAFGNYSGSLANGGERIALTVPDIVIATNAGNVATTNTIHIAINEVTYGDGGRWGNWSDGGGSSLELTDPDSDNRQPANWADSDETAKSQWSTIEFVGPTGASPTSETLSFNGDSLQIFQLGVGECLVDDVEVRVNNGNNIVANPGFESGTTSWTILGSHDMSTIENVGFTGTKSLHIRAASRGDNGANRIHTPLAPAAAGNVTMRCKLRWLRGWPETMMRLRGGSAEALGRMSVPFNLGTPGAPNSRLLVNAGPAIYAVSHSPVLPAAGENVVVSCKVNDPDGIGAMTLKYRVESGLTVVTRANFSSVTMTDNGTGGDAVAGDGIYSATLQGRPASGIVSFYLEAVDSLGATNLFPQDVFPPAGLPRCFPNDAVARECVIRWGEVQMLGSFATYHLWLTVANSNRWALRTPQLNNSPLDGTFVYNNYRSVYNSLPQYAGSPWHRGAQTQGPAGNARVDFVQNFPVDDLMLGQTDFVLNNPGNPDSPGPNTSDTSAQTEQTSYLLFNEIGLVYNYRRYIHHFVNGNQRSTTGQRPGNFIFEDSQQPNQDMVNEWYPDDTDGELWKIEDWFEFPDDGFNFSSNNDADLQRRTILQNGQQTLYPAPYRFMYRKRSLGPGESANDYTKIFKMIDAVSPTPAYSPSGISNTAPVPDVNQFNRIIDNEQWMRIFAVQRTCGNWDSYGYNRGKNDYAYIGSKNGSTFSQLTWDIDFTMGVGGDGSSQGFFDRLTDTRMTGIYNTPGLVRAYWRGFYDIAYGPLTASFLNPIVQAKQAALQLNNVNVDPNTANTIMSFAAARRTYIIQQFNNLTNAFNVTSPTSYTTNGSLVSISGYAPIFVKDIAINGVVFPVTWTSVTSWVARVVLNSGTNNLTVQALDRLGATNATRNVAINYTGPVPTPEGNVVFNEIMYAPPIPGAEFVEIYNRTNLPFNLSGWRINGLDYQFPAGSVINPGQYLVLAKDQGTFTVAYGTNLPVFDVFYGNLDRDGETLTLLIPSGPGYSEVVVDKIRYENRRPWSPNAASGASLQLVDSSIDNSRPSDWAAGGSWLNVTRTANISTATNLLLWLTGAGNCFIDDISLTATNEDGTNIVLNGDFESDLSGPWVLPAIYSTSYITNGISHSGARSLFVNGTAGGSGLNVIQQWIGPRVPTNVICTLSYWILINTNAVTVRVRTLPGSAIDTTAIAQSIIGTPGANNIFASSLPPYDPLWLNELQASNVAGITDNFGDRDPWVEIYNGGSNTLTLDGYFLAATYEGNLQQWPFPNGVTVGPRQFKLVWVDGEPQETVGVTHLHANFRLNSTTGSVALVRTVGGASQITDYLTYSALGAGLSYGDYPDGQPFVRRIFQSVTPSGTNISRGVNVFINEWMAGNTTNSMFSDPADGDFNDWFELYNAGEDPVDLSGYYLTDNLGNTTKYQVPTNSHYIIPAGGFLLVWADSEPEQNSADRADLHVSFRLSGFLGDIGLFAPDGESQIDAISYGQQIDDVSQGRCADGAAPPFGFFLRGVRDPSPRAANHCTVNNLAPNLNPIGDRIVRVDQTLNFNALATDPDAPPQTLSFSLMNEPAGAIIGAASGIFTWTPTIAQAYTTNHVTISVTDNGTPPLSDSETIVIIALPRPKAGIINNAGNLSISFDTIPGRAYRVEFKTNLDDDMWLPLTESTPAIGTTMIVPDTLGADTQRFYRIVETN